MKKKKMLFLCILLLFFINNNIVSQVDSIDYFGQKLPGYYPEKFAEGILVGGQEYIANFSPDGKEFYFPSFISGQYSILYMENINGVWSKRKTASFCEEGPQEASPSFSPDGNRIYYISNRNGGLGDWDIYYVERTDSGWSAPINPGSPLNSSAYEDYPYMANDGKFYFISKRAGGIGDADLYQSSFIDGKFQDVVNMGDSINSKYYDEEPVVIGDKLFFTINAAQKLKICYKSGDQWSKAEILSEGKFGKGNYYGFRLTPDEKYFLYMCNQQMYWVDAEVLDYLGTKEAPFDYITSWYAGVSAQMQLALHPQLVKRKVNSSSSVTGVDYNWMIDAVKSCKGCVDDIKKAQKDVVVLNESETVATVKVVSNEYADYLHLAKIKNKWKIINVLWEYKSTEAKGTRNEAEQVIKEYIDSWNTGNSEIMGKILHKNFKGRMALSLTETQDVDYNWMISETKNLKGKYSNQSGNINHIEILDTLINMASAKISFNDSVEYLHLSYTNDRWYIINSLRNFQLISSSPLAINKYPEASITYPNPANKQFNITFGNMPVHKAEIKIYNIHGEIVYSKTFNESSGATINLKDKTEGTYLIKLNLDGNIISKKVCIL